MAYIEVLAQRLHAAVEVVDRRPPVVVGAVSVEPPTQLAQPLVSRPTAHRQRQHLLQQATVLTSHALTDTQRSASVVIHQHLGMLLLQYEGLSRLRFTNASISCSRQQCQHHQRQHLLQCVQVRHQQSSSLHSCLQARSWLRLSTGEKALTGN